jgi:hypothetical protein
MSQKLCKKEIKKEKSKSDLKYICEKCGTKSNKKHNLCKPLGN